MRKKFFIVFGAVLVLAVSYLLIINPLIYYRIGRGNLPYLDVSPMYKFNEQADSKPLTYVAMGDSLTYGAGVNNFKESYSYLIAQKLANNNTGVRLLPLAFPGYKSGDLLGNLLVSAVSAQPDIVTIMIGVNDIHGRVPITEFKDNYQKIITKLKSDPKTKIYLVSIPFIGDSNLMPFPYQEYFVAQTKEYNEQIKSLAKENKVTFIDITTDTLETFEKSGTHYSVDRFHPSAEGYKLFAKLIYEHLSK
ncbi:MAG: SGNH/GDSL hydrolase family protein [Patescibacteria group bacterium]